LKLTRTPFSLAFPLFFDVFLQYVLNFTGNETLSYIGFSQGTAQAFAAFSRNEELASKINIFIALGALTVPKRTFSSPVPLP
jgi:lysosomal acid lipase/cholesteryl ester hydrolase